MALRETYIPDLPQLTIMSVASYKALEYQVKLGQQAEICSHCGSKLQRTGWLKVKLADLPRGGRPVLLHVSYQRLRCPKKCALPPALEKVQAGLLQVQGKRRKGRGLTIRLAETLLRRYLKGHTIPALSQWCGVSEHILWNLVDGELTLLRSVHQDATEWQNLTHIGIDELFWQGRILCVFVDLATGQLIDILPDRDITTVSSVLNELKMLVAASGQYDWSPVIVSDMWADYRIAASQVFGANVRFVADRFHLQAKISEDLNMEVKTVVQPLQLPYEEQRKVFRRMRMLYLIYTRERKAPVKFPKGISFIKDEDARSLLLKLLQQAVELTLVWQAPDREEAERRYYDWLWNAGLSSFPKPPPFGRLRFLYNHWVREIFAVYDAANALPGNKRPSNGRVEAINGRLRHLIRTSRAHSKNSFAQGQNELAEQQHYERFRLRCLAVAGGLLEQEAKKQVFMTVLRPVSVVCLCGTVPLPEELSWKPAGHLLDLPLGDKPVRAVVEQPVWQCQGCGKRRTAKVTASGTTPGLNDYILSRRYEGASWNTLQKETGVSRQGIQELLPTLPAVKVPDVPQQIGILPWRWRRKLRLVVTDPQKGKLLDIFPDTEEETLNRLAAYVQPALTVLLANPELIALLPEDSRYAFDPWTTKRLIQPALREVQQRFTRDLPVATRRTFLYYRHRRSILTRPIRLMGDEQQRLQTILGSAPEMRRAYDLLQQFHHMYETDWESYPRWKEEVEKLRAEYGVYPEDKLQRTLVYAFRDAVSHMEQYKAEIQAGRSLKVQGITLGSSRQLLSQLKGLEAARQPDFELLRYAAFKKLGE